ncbi:MAG: carboxyltransferase domain-containing protein [Ottowia sp.]|nr:carboxyltransferase domain-containing protein [Ottowia sp.]
MRVLPAGDTALLVELQDLTQALALYRSLQARTPAGVAELVPAARTVLVRYEPAATSQAQLEGELLRRGSELDHESADQPEGRVVSIPVHYDGADLPQLAELLGLSVQEVIRRHTSRPWQAAFAGFSPGFVYLAGDHFGRDIPRHRVPRTQVPAGSVALAGRLSAIYPSNSPGGWQLLGTTDIAMWDLDREEPAYLQPGLQVQFVDAGARKHVNLPAARRRQQPQPPAPQPASGSAVIEFVQPGLQTLPQDRGRPGKTQLGVSASGALDRGALERANQLVGNPPGTPVLENTFGQMTLRCHGRATLAVAGASVPLALHAADGTHWPLRGDRAIALDDGDTLVLGSPQRGLRCTLAARGGWQLAAVLDSCSRDTLAGLGPPPIAAGARLAVGRAVAPRLLRAVALAEPAAATLPRMGETVTLDVALGPRSDWFTPEALALLQSQPWRVTPQSDRVGMRLDGPKALARSRDDELPSEGIVSGAVQVPASGQPLLFLADHPLTGGYPVIAVILRHHLDLAAQIPPGCDIRFNVVAPFNGKSHA